MTQLLVSVRNAAEAEAALAGGAHVIDVKEPSRGSLGRADETTLAEVVRVVAGRRPISAALGELRDAGASLPRCLVDFHFVKWGLSDFRQRHQQATATRDALSCLARILELKCEIVTVAYADAERANAPEVGDVCDELAETRAGPLLLDTFEKDGRTLLDWLTVVKIERIVERCRSAGVRVALAGALDFDEIRALKYLRPDWFAVRGAACRNRQRNAAVDEGRVRQLVELLGEVE